MALMAKAWPRSPADDIHEFTRLTSILPTQFSKSQLEDVERGKANGF
jgi:hypothetical protein